MEFDNILFFAFDPAKCVKEDDDPADAICMFYPFEISVDAQCSWCGQLLGLYQFWKNSFGKEMTLARLSTYLVVLKEIDGILFAFGRNLSTADKSDPNDIVKTEMKECLVLITDVFSFYFGGVAGISFSTVAQRHDIFSSILSTYDLSREGLNFKLDKSALFRNARSVQQQADNLLRQMYSSSDFRRQNADQILCGLLAFRTDVIIHDIAVKPSHYASLLLTACLRITSDFSGTPSDLPPTNQNHDVKFFRVFLPTEDLQAMRLARNLRIAAGNILKSSASTLMKPPAGMAESTMRKSVPGRTEVLLCIVQTRSTFLAFLLDQASPDSKTLLDLKNQCYRLVHVMEKLDDEAINHILGHGSSISLSSPKPKSISKSRRDGVFNTLPDDEEEQRFIRLAHLTFHAEHPFSLSRLQLRKQNAVYTAIYDGEEEQYSFKTSTRKN